MFNFKSLSIIMVLFLLIFSSIGYGDINEQRSGEANPMVSIGKATLYGAGTGILLGLAGSLVIDKPFWEVMKWSFVGGTGGGFLVGTIYVLSRPSAADENALLEFDRKNLAKISLPPPKFAMNPDKSVELEFQIVKINL